MTYGYSHNLVEANKNANPEFLGVAFGRMCIELGIPATRVAEELGVPDMPFIARKLPEGESKYIETIFAHHSFVI